MKSLQVMQITQIVLLSTIKALTLQLSKTAVKLSSKETTI